jgi:hypothetical protein
VEPELHTAPHPGLPLSIAKFLTIFGETKLTIFGEKALVAFVASRSSTLRAASVPSA